MKKQSIGYLLALCLAMALGVHNVIAEEVAANTDFVYQVQAGDNLGVLSAQLLDSPARWSEVAQYNKLKNPNLVFPKQTLNIPLAWMKNHPAQARIEALTGEVKLNGKPAQIGDMVNAGDKLETANGASTRMHLPDGSTLNLLEKSELQTKELQKKEQGNFFSAVFRLVTGRIDAIKKKYPDGQSPLRIQAMHGTIGVRGTHFRVGQEGENTLAEIENGLVGFDAGKASLALAGGQGSVADGVHAPSVVTLLAAPQFPKLPESFAPDAVSFDMPAMAGALAYRGEVAKDEAFAELLAPVLADGWHIAITGLQEGSYWLRLRAVDEHGLQGLSSQVALTVKVPPVVIPPPPPADFPIVTPYKPITNGESLLTGWKDIKGYQYQLQIAATQNFASTVYEVKLKTDYLTLPTLPTGDYFLRLRLYDEVGRYGAWCEPVAFTTW